MIEKLEPLRRYFHNGEEITENTQERDKINELIEAINKLERN